MLNFSEVRKNQSGMLHVNFGVIRIAKSHATPLADETAIIYFDLRFDNEVYPHVQTNLYSFLPNFFGETAFLPER